MNSKVQNFIELWKEKRSLKTLMDSDMAMSDIEELRSELMEMDPAKRQQAETILQEIADMLVERIEILEKKCANAHEGIKHSKKTKKACLAYQKQKQNATNHKEEMAEHMAHKIAKIQETEKRLRNNLQITEKSEKE